MTNHNYCVILAGGIGSRFWPVSREDRPKQFLDPAGSGRSFLKSTWARMSRLFPQENILVVSLAKYRDQVLAQLPSLREENLILEPYGRSTAPSISLAARVLLLRDPDALMLVTPSDHHIGDRLLFEKSIKNALEYAAQNEVLLTLGVVPSRPDTNFGYIQVTGGKEACGEGKPVKVKTFTEKPDQELAKVFVESGEFLWNSGIFVWKAAVIRSEIQKYAPEISRVWRGWDKALGTPQEASFVERAYADSPRNSIDYAMLRVFHDEAGEMPLPQKINAIDNSNKKGKMYFYLGLFYDMFGGIEAAKQFYTKVVDMKSPMFFEYRLAEWRMEADAGSIKTN